MNNQGQLDFIDILSVLSFFIGLANYQENVGQGQMQDAIQEAVSDIHRHLQEQDDKLDMLLGDKQNDNS